MINYLCTSPKPNLKKTDALYNEINLLQNKFKGSITSLYPFSTPSSKYPVILNGIHNFGAIRKLDNQLKINHIFAPSIFHLPIVYFFKKPTIYTIVAGVSNRNRLPINPFMKRIASFIVSNERDYQTVRDNGIKKVHIIRTAIDISSFEKHRLPKKEKLHLLLASAPWEMKQFKTKGIHLLLEALQKSDNLAMTFLWRNILPEYMETLIKHYKVEDKVTFINEVSDVNSILKKVHGTVLLTNDCSVVKAYPHSLIESVISGKPVIVSHDIPMADYVVDNKCGLVLQDYSIDGLMAKLKEFNDQYHQLSEACMSINPWDFSADRLLKDYKNLYANVLDSKVGRDRESLVPVGDSREGGNEGGNELSAERLR